MSWVPAEDHFHPTDLKKYVTNVDIFDISTPLAWTQMTKIGVIFDIFRNFYHIIKVRHFFLAEARVFLKVTQKKMYVYSVRASVRPSVYKKWHTS